MTDCTLRPRIIPVLLVHNGGLVKTVRFQDPKYVGDPVNAVRIFNEKAADELIVLDIDATVRRREPDYELIRNLAAECRMPLCYGGGIKTAEQADRVVNLGVEKVAVSSEAIENPAALEAIARRIGSQSVVAVADVKRDRDTGTYQVWTRNGSKASNRNVVDVVESVQSSGAGEVVVNSIENDGVMEGYDLALVRTVRPLVRVPFTVLGGAGRLDHLEALIRDCGLVGAAAGSLFVFKGAYRAVLISYPRLADRGALVVRAHEHRPVETSAVKM